jgi:hypothetical protein
MTCDADLAADHAVMSERNRTGHTDLRHKQAVRPYFCAMPDSDHVPHFASLPYYGIVQAPPFNYTPGTYLNIILYANSADMRNLVMHAVMCRKTETVISDSRICLNNHPVPDFTPIINYSIGINNAIVPDLALRA